MTTATSNTNQTDRTTASGGGGGAGGMPCFICADATPHEKVYEVSGYGISRCRACGIGTTNVPHDFDPAPLYAEEYFEGGVIDGYADYAATEPILRAEARRSLMHLARYGYRSGKLLEVGCAYGYFLAEAAAASFDVMGVEVSASSALRAREHLGMRVITGTIDAADVASSAPFDVVTMLDVIEHLRDPAEVLATVRDRLRPNGVLLLTTGDWGSLLARVMGKRWRLMTPPQHLWFFSMATLEELLRRTGFKVLETTHPSKRVPLSLALFQLGRYAGRFAPALSFFARHAPPLALPVNLFDAMRVIAVRA